MSMENFTCPHCGKEIEAAKVNSWKAKQVGSNTSEKKATSSAENGKKGGRPPALIRKENIIVTEKLGKSTIGERKVGEKHLTGWWLSFEFPDGKTIKKFYQCISFSLKEAKHLFYKTCVENHRTEYERKKE